MRHRNKYNTLDPLRISKYNNFLITLDKSNVNTINTINTTDTTDNIYTTTTNTTTQTHTSANTQNTTSTSSTSSTSSTLNNNINSFVCDANNKDSHNKTEEKCTLDNLIKIIDNNFKNKSISSVFVTGKSLDSIMVNTIGIDDPNIYKNESIPNKNHRQNGKKIYIYGPTINKQNTTTKRKNDNPSPVNTDNPSSSDIIKETITIDQEINNVSDILKLIEQFKLDASIDYNINMKALHDIKEPLQELNNMIGMKDIKNNIVDQILYFIQNLHKSKGNNNSGDFMHTVIYGPPGTGKTEIAKLMGKIYSKVGILNKGTFKKVTRSDLIAGYLGQTALKTRDVIHDALGGVLFIDEAYALGNSDKKDSFSKECIDTLCEALSDNKENLMVIIAGYEEELKDCFFNYNQGLDSRFAWRFKTEQYSGEDLYGIFLKKVQDIGWSLHPESNITAEWFNKNIDYFKFFGRDIEIVLAKTKVAHSKRVFCKPEEDKRKIILKDLEKGFEMYLNNSDIKNKREKEHMKKQLYSSIYC